MSLVLIAIPLGPDRGAFLHRDLFTRVLELSHDSRHDVTVLAPTERPTAGCRNLICGYLLNFSDAEWLLMIDADNPPLGNPLDAIAHDKDIVVFPTPIWVDTGNGKPTLWNTFVEEGNVMRPNQRMTGLQRVDLCGTGSILIRRKVIETLGPHPFADELGPEGRMVAEHDIKFSQLARAKGFEIHADYNCPCRHYKLVDLLEIDQAFVRLSAPGNLGSNWVRHNERKTLPWMSIGHADAIWRACPEARTILEWGSGGSTVWLAQMFPQAQLVSIDNKSAWHEWVRQVLNALKPHLALAEVKLIHEREHDTYLQAAASCQGCDIALVDGAPQEWRADCIRLCKHSIKPRHLFIHNAELEDEQKAINECHLNGTLSLDTEKVGLYHARFD